MKRRLRYLIGLILLSLCVTAAVDSRELPAQTVVGTIPVGSLPHGVGVNPFTNRAYVANYGSGTVSVIDDTPSIASWINEVKRIYYGTHINK